MKRAIVFLIAAVVIVLSATFPHLMINPGELSEGHQKIKYECTNCHRPFGGIETSRCISCHMLDEIGQKDSVDKNLVAVSEVISFHDKLKNIECTECHTDHNGDNGQNLIKRFEHELLQVDVKTNCSICHIKPTDKLHDQLSLSCNGCHNTTGWKFESPFNHDMITGMNKSNCTICHQRPPDTYHQTLKDNCDKCHNTNKWSPSTFDHSSYFVLDKNHTAKCITCHTNKNFKTYTCYGCHEHSENKMLRKHEEQGILNISDCASCHRSGDEHELKYRDEGNSELKSRDIENSKDHGKSKEKKENEEAEGEDDD